MTPLRLTVLALALSLGVASCHAGRVTSVNGGFALEASISDASIRPGETAIVTYRLRNASDAPLTVSVSGCGPMQPYVTDDNGAFVYPARGVWICTMELRPPVTLAPGDEITRTFQVSGEAAPASGGMVRLRPGRYSVYVEGAGGRRDDRGAVRLRSDDVAFEVAG